MSTDRSPKTLDVTDQQKLLDALLRNGAPAKTRLKGIRNHLMGCLMLYSGLRVGEVVKLRIDDLLFNHKPVSSLVLRPSITKNHKERIVPVNIRLRDSISQMSQSYWPPPPGDCFWYAFYNTICTKQITTRQVENIINSAGMKSLGRPVNPHMLRHTFASRLMRVTNMRTVQELLGHNFITSTQVYTHPNEDDKKKAVEDVERLENSTHPDYADE